MKKWISSIVIALFTASGIALAIAKTEKLVVYSGRGEALVAPLLKQFEQDTGIKVEAHYNSTPVIATQVLHEGKDTPADVVFFQESSYLSTLAKADLLEKLDDKLTAQVENRFRDDNGYWLGVSGRLRVLAYNTNMVKPDDLPKKLQSLTDPKWKGKIGWAPANASAQAHMTALRELWGEKKLEAWLKDMKANDPVSYAKNSQIVSDVGKGRISLGWVNHYYLHQLKKQNKALPVENYHFPADGKDGNILIVSGAALLKNSANKEAAKTFLNYLVSKKAQEYFNRDNFEYPARSDVVAEGLTPLDQIPLANVSQASLADLKPTLALLQKLNLL